MSARAVTWLDVFTSQPLTGNALAVIHDADDLPDRVMLAIARETRLSETTFIQRPVVGGADYRNRIFSPPGELPFAGHPSLGTAVAWARRRGEREGRYVQETRAGLQPVEVRLTGAVAHASMLQEPATYGATPAPARVAAAVGIPTGDLDPRFTPVMGSTGAPHLLVGVRDAGVLGRVQPRHHELGVLLGELGAICIYLAAVSPTGGVRARSYYLNGGVATEDPATGSAAGPLVALLDAEGVASRIEIDQGVEMGRASRLLAEVGPEGVRVGGDVVVIAESTALL